MGAPGHSEREGWWSLILSSLLVWTIKCTKEPPGSVGASGSGSSGRRGRGGEVRGERKAGEEPGESV
jgi:hypothetical protein